MQNDMTQKEVAYRVIEQLHAHGHEACLAGGCVRDMLLGVDAKDYDVATNATPQRVAEIFKKTVMVGAQFGVAAVLMKNTQVEVATFRSDGFYGDGRRPDSVVYTDAKHDALRRDFTINGMFYDITTHKVIDYVGGQDDLKQGIIRAIGKPDDRFNEDHLRMLRAVRFASQLDFSIEAETAAAIVSHAKQLSTVSEERVLMELAEMLKHRNRTQSIALILQYQLAPIVFIGLTETNITFGQKMLTKLESAVTLPVAFSYLLIALGAKKANTFCRKLRVSNEVRNSTVEMISSCLYLQTALPLTIGHVKLEMAKPYFSDLLYMFDHYLDVTNGNRDQYNLFVAQVASLKGIDVAPVPFLNGDDLINIGITPGKKMGELLKGVYLAQLEGELDSTEAAVTWIKEQVN